MATSCYLPDFPISRVDSFSSITTEAVRGPHDTVPLLVAGFWWVITKAMEMEDNAPASTRMPHSFHFLPNIVWKPPPLFQSTLSALSLG